MASNFIPMLSSSPPPLDDCPDNDDDDDEFGTFTSANIPFDSSFDSPVAGEKYKPFKAGVNGVNEITFNNDTNTFCSYSDSQPPSTPKYTLNFLPQTKNKCKNNSTSDENAFFPDHVEKRHSSSEDIPSKVNSSTSQNCVPDSIHTVNHDSESSCVVQEGSNCLERTELTTCSKEETFKRESEFPDSSNSNCDADVIKKPLFVPPSDDEFVEIENSNEMHFTCDQTKNTFQSSDIVEECQESLTVVNTSECDIQSSNDTQNNVEGISNSALQNSTSENPDSKFSTDLPYNDEFIDFQTANSVNDSTEKCSDIERKSIDEEENPETFEADFADFQSSEDYHFDDSKFGHSYPSEKYSNLEADEFGDFGSFQTNEDCPQSDADEFDDFQTCDKVRGVHSLNEDKHVATSSVCDNNNLSSSNEPTVPNQEDFDEDFDDFQVCSEVAAPVEQGFADFETQPFDLKEESEFANFESASFNSASSETFQNSVHPSMSIPTQEKNVDKLSTVINTIFPLNEEESIAADASYDPASEILEQCNKSRRLWEKLHEIEQTPGLRFQWGVSHSFQQLLRSVNVDYHSILRTSSVPIFASSLSLLEPVKGQANSANQESDDKVQSPKDPIPPVEFDWNTSGLVNPLDSGQSASMLMDLSFLSSSESVTSSSLGNNSFENELLKPSPVSACSESSNTNFILEELLSKNVCSIPNSKIAHRQPNLSEEANNVLDQLPDLSFMRAKVLMFPISSKT